MSDFRETLYTVDAAGNRKWVYPTEVTGWFGKKRRVVASILLLIYVIMPWITIGHGQAILIDLPQRRFLLFGATFIATDTRFLFVLLLTLAISLFFFSSLFGRVWCGWACPETVFLEFLFRPIERWIEGNANARRKLDQSPWNLRKVVIKGTKYLVFALLAWFLASTLLAYFVGRERLLTMMADYPWHNWPTFLLTLAVMAVLLFQFGWFREQFCTVLCPYARFQSVLLDDTSLTVGYDSRRGEPRGKRRGGDCVDCGLCVRVCPTGIDIRNGLQLECVQCTACIDACDSVMVKLNRKPKLIRYDTERGLRGDPVRFLRPRVVLYGTILIGLLSLFGYLLHERESSDVALFHPSRDNLYSVAGEGILINHLELSISNKSDAARAYSVDIIDLPEAKVVLPVNPFPVPGDAHLKIPIFVTFAQGSLRGGRRTVQVEVRTDNGDFKKRLTLELIGPG